MEENTKKGRELLRNSAWETQRDAKSDQQLHKPAPPLEQPFADGTEFIELPAPATPGLGGMSVKEAIERRRSVRKYSETPLSLSELSFLLWATQGVREVADSGKAALRFVPSGGARHTFETYLAVRNVAGLTPGTYRYAAFKHALCKLTCPDEMDELLKEAFLGQRCATVAAVNFIWTSVPYRAEWRYMDAAAKMIAIDAGHVCQNLYLACEAISCGTVAVGAYSQSKMDTLIGVDGADEFVIYAAPVGKV